MKKWCGVLCLWVLMLSAACGANPSPVPTPPNVSSIAPSATATLLKVAQAATAVVVPNATLAPTRSATNTRVPTLTHSAPTPTATETNTAPAPIASPTITLTPTLAAPTALHGDAANGAVLFQKMGCKGCHMPPPNSKRIAPDLAHITTDAEQFIHSPDYKGSATDVASYIRESIVDPNAFVVPAFRYLTADGSSIMPLDFAKRLTPQEIQDLVAYVLTIR
jgi:cytochrome c551/c552